MNKGKEEIKILVVFSFGSKETEGNKELVNAIRWFTGGDSRWKIITQKDIPLSEGDVFRVFVEDFKRSCGWHSTLWVANAAIEICDHYHWPKVAHVLAAPMHIKRCVRDLKRIGFEKVKPFSFFDGRGIRWYDKKSSLPWTRSWLRWWHRELKLRLLPWFLYKKLTLK